ncbi:MAG TPA: choice-of-anchor D domain-containing protein [Acidimicrobiales bacterium]
MHASFRRALAFATVAVIGVATVVAVPPPAAAEHGTVDGFVFIDDEPHGSQEAYSTEDGTPFSVHNTGNELLSVETGDNSGLHLTFVIPGGIEPGTYALGENYGDPRLGVMAAKNSCYFRVGTLTIHESTYAGGVFTNFAASFAAKCEYAFDDVRGEVRINSDRPVQGRRLTGVTDFGFVRVGEESATRHTIENPGRGTLEIDEIDLTSSVDFGVGEDTCTGAVLAVGEECSFVLVAHPSAAGRRTAELILRDSITPEGRHVGVLVDGEGPSISVPDLIFGAPMFFADNGPFRWYVDNTGAVTESLLELNVVDGDWNEFAIEPGSCIDGGGNLVDIAGGAHCWFDVWLTPSAPGTHAMTVELVTASASYQRRFSYTVLAPPAEEPPRTGYWMVDSRGTVYAFGDAKHFGNAPVSAPAVDVEATPSGNGYWVVDENGAVHTRGDARYLGGSPPLAAAEHRSTRPSPRPADKVTSIAATPDGDGYWLFSARGHVFPYGTAQFYGAMGHTRLNGPILDSIPTPSGEGYYMVGSDGGIFTFGDAAFEGSMGGTPLNAPVQSLVPDLDGSGYWLVASDGGIFAFEAPFRGSMGGTRLNRPVTGMVGYDDGYLMVGEDGGIFTFGDAPFRGSLGANPPPVPVVSVAPLLY